jgi:hypothetical protein
MLNKARVIALVNLSFDLHEDAEIEAYPSTWVDNRWFIDILTPTEEYGAYHGRSSYICEIDDDGVKIMSEDRVISRFTLC